MAGDVAAELEQIQAALQQAGARSVVETGETGQAVWADFLGHVGEDRLLARLGAPVKELAKLLSDLPLLEPENLLLDYPSGLLYLRHKPVDIEDVRQWLEALRRPALARGGYAITLAVPLPFHAALDPWGYRPAALDIMQRLKDRWDPAHILNPGGFVVV
jgi:glycolate oxidase FAD binding subunit